MKWVLLLVAACALSACNRGGEAGNGNMLQTKAPGHIAAGGRTSGEVIATSAQPKDAGGSGPAGTPGIPQGKEGNTGGAAIVGGSSGQAPTPPPPVTSEKAGNAPPSADVKTGANQSPPGVRSDAPAKAGK